MRGFLAVPFGLWTIFNPGMREDRRLASVAALSAAITSPRHALPAVPSSRTEAVEVTASAQDSHMCQTRSRTDIATCSRFDPRRGLSWTQLVQSAQNSPDTRARHFPTTKQTQPTRKFSLTPSIGHPLFFLGQERCTRQTYLPMAPWLNGETPTRCEHTLAIHQQKYVQTR